MTSQSVGANAIVVPDLGSRLLNLPGELRNNVYEYLLYSANVPSRDEEGDKVDYPARDDRDLNLDLNTAVAAMSTCRQLRAEYMPLFFNKGFLSTWFYELESFLKTFFPSDGPAARDFTHKPDCSIEVAVDCIAPDLDIMKLAATVRENPTLTIFFHAQSEHLEWEAEDLNNLVEYARENATAWDAYRQDIESCTLVARHHWDPYLHEYYWGHRPVWKMETVLKGSAITTWWHKKARRIAHTRQLVSSLGLSKPEIVDGRTVSNFSGLKVEVSRMGQDGREASRYGGMCYWSSVIVWYEGARFGGVADKSL